MSHNVMRKAQPFTIGTRLSLPKCPDFSTSGPGLAPLDSSFLPLSLNDRMSQYLAQTCPSSNSPPRGRAAPPHSQGDGFSSQVEQSQMSPTRSIRKITLSSRHNEAQSHPVVRVNPRVFAQNWQGNVNNNNSQALWDTASKIHGSSRNQTLRDLVQRSPVSLCGTEVRDPSPGPCGSPCALYVTDPSPGPRGSPCLRVGRIGSSPCELSVRNSMSRVCGSLIDQSLRDVPGHVGGSSGVRRITEAERYVTATEQSGLSTPSEHRAVSGDGVTAERRPSLGGGRAQVAKLSLDIKQAETWIQEKLQELRNRANDSPIQDPELPSQNIEEHIRGLEGTIMKLSQVGEHLSKAHPPSGSSLRVQLQSLRDQWQLLKQTATNQSRAVSGVKTLQEFNKKADELEIWMREKQEVKLSLPLLLDENLDKVQLTRQILDLKQEQLHHRNLQEDINHLAQKLEKPVKAENKAASNRRKQLNKMWLRLQDTLLEHQQCLQLALEASSLWQQADGIFNTMEGKKTCAERNEPISEHELRDIASKIMILDVAVSQISSLHPVLSARAGHKQRQVKECWSRLQGVLRTCRSSGPLPAFTREPDGLLTPGAEEQSSVGNCRKQRVAGPQSETKQPPYTEDSNAMWSPSWAGSDVISVRHSKRKQSPWNGHRARSPCGSHDELRGQDTPQVTDLMNELTSTEQWLHALEVHLSEPATLRSPEVIRRNLKEVSILEKEVKSRGLALNALGARVRESGVKDWDLSEETLEKVQEVKERVQTVQDSLRQRTSDLRDTLVLSEFMKVVQLEEERRSRTMSGSGGAIREGLCDPGMEGDPRNVFTPREELQEAVEILNDAAKERERSLALGKERGHLQSRLTVLSQMICTAQEWLDEIARQAQEAERHFATMKSQADLRDLQELFIQHQDLEYNVSGPILLEVSRLEDQLDRLQALTPDKKHVAEVGQTLQAWARLQEKVRENKACLERTDRLRRFFLRYLEMISWTEETRTLIFAESAASSRDEELDQRIEEKLRQFEELATIGWRFIGEDHFLTPTIRERLEELQGMLSWVLMRWRSRKKQRVTASRAEKQRLQEVPVGGHGLTEQRDPDDGITIRIPPQASGSPPGVTAPTRGHPLRRYSRKTHSPLSLQNHLTMLSTASEVDIPPHAELKVKRSEGPVWLEPKEIPTESERMEKPDPCYMVSAYLHMESCEQPARISCQSLTIPRPNKSSSQSRAPLQCTPFAGAFSGTLPKTQPCLLFSSLERKEKALKCSDLRVPGLYVEEKSCHLEEANVYQTHTWPPKQSKKVLAAGPDPDRWKPADSKKTPHAKDGGAERWVSRSEEDEHICENHNGGQTPGTASICRDPTVASAPSLEIRREAQGLGKVAVGTMESSLPVGLLGSIMQEGYDMNPDLQISCPASKSRHSLTDAAWIEALSQSSGYCRQNLHGYAKSRGNQSAHQLRGSADAPSDLKQDSLSTHHQTSEPQSDRPDLILNPFRSHGGSNLSSTGSSGRNAEPKGHPLDLMETMDLVYRKTSSDCGPRDEISAGQDCNTETFPNVNATQLSKSVLPRNAQPHSGLGHPAANQSFYESPPALPDVLHPDQEFLEQDDEELEGIWNNAKCSKQVPCPSHPPEATQDRRAERGSSAKTIKLDLHKPASGKVMVTTQPNMLVATFALPTLEPEKVNVTSGEESPGQRNHHSNLHQQEPVGNGPAGDSRGIEPPASLEETAKRERGTDDTKVPQRLDFQLMEGPLERKHTLQPGGRKASNRTWSVFYAVLVRRTLCFYHDRKHSTKSSVSASSLHLTGAVCAPDTNYTKRSNCFCLRLCDGSGYLLRAPSSSLVQDWVSKLQHNAGLEEMDLLSDPVLGSSLTPCRKPRASQFTSWVPDMCQLVPLPGSKMPAVPRDQTRHLQTSDERNASRNPPPPTSRNPPPPASRNPPPPAISQLLRWFPEESIEAPDRNFSNQGDTASRRRSQSFSSVTYQRMATSSPPKTPQSYSVTVYIGDSPVPRGRCHSFATSPEQRGWSRDPGIPKPRNLSVFKKFFRKKE